MNLALQGVRNHFSTQIKAEIRKRGIRIAVEYQSSGEIEIQVVNQATCEHEIKVEADEAYCPRCLKQLILADFVGED